MAQGKARQREQLAYLTARILAEDGSLDFDQARRKAARQAGVHKAQHLPDKHEIEAALRSWQSLYQGQELPQRRAQLRRLALKIMQRFEEFNPYLVGAVLSGHPGTHCDITIQLYSDFQKELEIVLLNQRIEVSGQSRAVKLGERTFNVEIYSFDEEGVVINLHVFPKNAERLIPKNTDKRALDRARIRQLQELINQEDCNISAA